MSILVVDVGTSGVRAAVVHPDALMTNVHYQKVATSSPAPGLLEMDAKEIASAALAVATASIGESGPVEGVGIANQRASTVLWDRKSGEPVGPVIGWQDLRTVFDCLELQGKGLRLAPNQSATKLTSLLSLVEPDRRSDLCFGTIDSWIAWTLSGGSAHVTDNTNAGLTGLVTGGGTKWDESVLDALEIPTSIMPMIVNSTGEAGYATALAGSPPICGIAGDQQASLIGQGCTLPGLVKSTFGTGGMLDCCIGETRPAFARSGEAGTIPIIAYSSAGTLTWGVEAIMLSAGSCIEWLADGLGIISNAAESETLGASVEDSGDVWFVPALFGLGTPTWDFGARGTFTGITRGTNRKHMVRAVLEGIAHRGADLLEAAEADTGFTFTALRVDGGMSANSVFTQALADATGVPIEISPNLEATAVGAAFLAGLHLGTWKGPDDIAATFKPLMTVDPKTGADVTLAVRKRWLAARERSASTIPELSTLSFW